MSLHSIIEAGDIAVFVLIGFLWLVGVYMLIYIFTYAHRGTRNVNKDKPTAAKEPTNEQD